jgi:hypothetical protein
MFRRTISRDAIGAPNQINSHVGTSYVYRDSHQKSRVGQVFVVRSTVAVPVLSTISEKLTCTYPWYVSAAATAPVILASIFSLMYIHA